MPFPNVPDHLTDEMDHCVKQAMADGQDEQSAIGICYKSVVEVQRTTEYHEATISPASTGADFEGRDWEVTIIGAGGEADLVTIGGREYIYSANGRLYSCEGLRKSVPQWDGIKVYDNHLTDKEFEERQGMRSVSREWVGTLVEPVWDDRHHGLRARLKIVEESLARKLKAAHDQGVLGSIGLSVDTVPDAHMVTYESRQVPAAEGFKIIFSVDVVGEPAAGGGFNRLIAAQQARVQEANEMTDEEVKALVQAEIAAALAAKQTPEQDDGGGEPTPEEAVGEVDAAAAQAAAEVAEDAPTDPVVAAEQAADAVVAAVEMAVEEVAAEVEAAPAASAAESAMDRVRKLECQILLRDRLAEAKLSAVFAQPVRDAFAGKIFKEAELVTMIKHQKEAQASIDTSGRVTGAGNGRAGVLHGGMSPSDKTEVEFLRLVAGNRQFKELEGAESDFVQERMPESVRAWIKAGRPNYGTHRISELVYSLLGGDPLSDDRAREAVTTSSMSSIVKNTVNILLAANYAKRHMWWEAVARTEEVDTIDDATLVRVYGLSNLSIVDEGQAYSELAWVDEEETASFVKKGNFVGVTIETLLRDKLNIIRSIPDRLATAWYNTISALVSGVFTVNSDTGPQLTVGSAALFNATATSSTGGHTNLLTAALNFVNFGAARTAMMKQTDQALGAGQKLLIQPKFLLVPVDLESAANQIRNSEMIPGSGDNDINPYYQTFDVIVVPNWTDLNNWALVGDPNEFPAIWLIYPRGRQVPELFTADAETAGAMFTNDTLRYKVRMLTYRFSSSYECAPVSDFRPLHKSNVS